MGEATKYERDEASDIKTFGEHQLRTKRVQVNVDVHPCGHDWCQVSVSQMLLSGQRAAPKSGWPSQAFEVVLDGPLLVGPERLAEDRLPPDRSSISLV